MDLLRAGEALAAACKRAAGGRRCCSDSGVCASARPQSAQAAPAAGRRPRPAPQAAPGRAVADEDRAAARQCFLNHIAVVLAQGGQDEQVVRRRRGGHGLGGLGAGHCACTCAGRRRMRVSQSAHIARVADRPRDAEHCGLPQAGEDVECKTEVLTGSMRDRKSRRSGPAARGGVSRGASEIDGGRSPATLMPAHGPTAAAMACASSAVVAWKRARRSSPRPRSRAK